MNLLGPPPAIQDAVPLGMLGNVVLLVALAAIEVHLTVLELFFGGEQADVMLELFFE